MPGHPYDTLGPATVLDAVESLGFTCDGALLALNSYENRVYQVGRDEADPVVVKFYRPGRWSTEAIEEEHAFVAELAALEIPAVAPVAAGGRTLHHHAGFSFAVYPRQGGREPDLEDDDSLRRLGRYLGRIHAAGAAGRFEHRPTLTIERLGDEARRDVMASGMLPEALAEPYARITEHLLAGVRRLFEAGPAPRLLRIHGDGHPGNILWRDGPHVVDFDDCMTGPAVQDLWMFLGGEREEREARLQPLLEGYGAFFDFDSAELRLIEALRALRLIHYSAWLARRWDDPAFPQAFPWFAGARYWETHIQTLQEQLAALDEPPLQLWD